MIGLVVVQVENYSQVVLLIFLLIRVIDGSSVGSDVVVIAVMQ